MSKPKTITVELEFPIEDADGRPIKELTFRRMKAKDAYVAESYDDKIKAGYALFATLAGDGVSIEMIEELTIDDLEKIGEQIAPLMGESGAAALQTARQQASQ